jgi:hypothetical protein
MQQPEYVRCRVFMLMGKIPPINLYNINCISLYFL